MHTPKKQKRKWGHTDAYKQSQKRVAKMTPLEMEAIQKAGIVLLKEISSYMHMGAESSQVQKLIDKHYNGLRVFYEPNLELYRGLGNMYTDDVRFATYFEKISPGLAEFMKKSMHIYCDSQK